MADNVKYSFSGHESFYCKSLWLKKGYDFVSANKNFNSEDAVVDLGVGKNMVASIRYWLRAFDLLDKKGNTTEIADYLFNNEDGRDPYIEDLGTLWLLHYLLVKTELASIYKLFFIGFQREKNNEFDDKIADKEIQNLIAYEKDILNKEINQSFESYEFTA